MDRRALLSKLLGGDQHLPQPLPTSTTPEHTTETLQNTSKPEIVDVFGNMRTNVENLSLDDLPGFHDFVDAEQAKHDVNNAGTNGGGAPKKPTATTPAPAPRPTNGDADVTIDERTGEPSEIGTTFCPFLAITKFPYRFVENRALTQPLASAYFDREQIYEREWDFYYIDARYSSSSNKPIILVTKDQVDVLLAEMNTAYPELKWQFGDYHKEIGLLITFDDVDAELRPRFLGHCNDRAKFEAHNYRAYEQTAHDQPSDEKRVEIFEKKAAEAFNIGKSSWKGGKGKSVKRQPAATAQPPTYRQDPNDKQLTKAKQYLGLADSPDDAGSKSLIPDVIFIAIDVEAWEQNHAYITEVGVATLDTRDLKAVDAGMNGKNWHQYIRGRHFRTKEYMDPSYTNNRHVQGCPNAFRFGRSEIVPKKDLPSILTSCFHHPFSSGSTDFDKDEVRQIVLLGHDTKTDIDYCHQMSFSVKNRGNLCDVMDTAAMYRHYSKEVNPRKLGSVLEAFDIDGWSLHNAGNDAVYTVQAILGICVADSGGNEEAKRVQESIAKMAATFGPPRPPGMQAASSGVTNEDGDEIKLPKGGGKGPPTSGFFTSGGAPLDV
ncbi:hypothetical protein LTR95_017459 [Oleoguttula sp. CCFEE 5521]